MCGIVSCPLDHRTVDSSVGRNAYPPESKIPLASLLIESDIKKGVTFNRTDDFEFTFAILCASSGKDTFPDCGLDSLSVTGGGVGVERMSTIDVEDSPSLVVFIDIYCSTEAKDELSKARRANMSSLIVA